ncbi:MAG: hypothetical protein HY903_12840 [Deltaproteobacteria bacterium]|nr:hypothetical protein [Deltaproteobacteria bacterium]
MTTSDLRPVPEWKLERYLLGELPQDEYKALEARIASEPSLSERVAVLLRSNAMILQQYPVEAEARQIRGRLHMAAVSAHHRAASRRRFSFYGLGAGALVTAAVVVLVVFATGPDVRLPPGVGVKDDGVLVKGGAQLVIFRRQGTDNEMLKSGDTARRGDVLQLSYRVAKPVFGAVLSIDGRGTITWHFPEGGQAAALDSGELTALPHAYELDDAPMVERFVLLTATEPFSLAPITAAVERVAKERAALADLKAGLPLPAGIEQTSLVLRKEEQP